ELEFRNPTGFFQETLVLQKQVRLVLRRRSPSHLPRSQVVADVLAVQDAGPQGVKASWQCERLHVSAVSDNHQIKFSSNIEAHHLPQEAVEVGWRSLDPVGHDHAGSGRHGTHRSTGNELSKPPKRRCTLAYCNRSRQPPALL